MKVIRFNMIWHILQVIIFFACGTTGAKIQLYKDNNYADLILETSLTDECYNTSNENWLVSHSSTITDTCVIFYWNSNCKSGWSFKFMPGKTSHSAWNGIKSLQKCNDQEGGSELNVDITTHFQYSGPPIFPTILESYYDVCACINVPQYVQDMSEWSIDNHHNGLFVYFEPDCTEQNSKALYINAGHNSKSRNMHTNSRTYKGSTLIIQSFGPDPNSTYFQQSCLYPNDKVMKVELLEAVNSSSIKIGHALNPAANPLTSGANDDPIHFFSDIGYQGLHFGSRSTSKCNKFPKPVRRYMINGVGSVQTNKCIILYLDNNCTGRSIKIEAPGNGNLTNLWESTVTGERTLSRLYTKYSNWKWETTSWQACNNEKGGPSLNVEIYFYDPIARENDGSVNLETYENVCTCRNIPEYVQQLDGWSINNNGNAMMAYFSADCLSTTLSPLWIPAGLSSYSMGLGSFEKTDDSTGITYKIQSLGPDPNSDYFINNCNTNCTEVSMLGNGEITGLNSTDICDFDTKSESAQVALLILERMQALEANLEKRSKEIMSLLEKAALNLKNTKHDFNNNLQKQKDEIQELTDKLNSHIHE